MTAIALLAELKMSGVRLSRKGDRLHVEARPGILTAKLRERLAASKPALLVLLSAPNVIREKLLMLAADERVPATIVQGLHTDHLAACVGCTDSELRAYLRALARSARMDAGFVPDSYTVADRCPLCGPVWLPEPMHPAARTCPWCSRRIAGKAIPRPPVACGDCAHRLPDPINPEAGMGGCGLSAGRSQWPMHLHPCADHRPIENKAKQ